MFGHIAQNHLIARKLEVNPVPHRCASGISVITQINHVQEI